MRIGGVPCLLLVLLLPFSAFAAQGEPSDPQLENGIRLAQQGDFEAAITVLDAVAGRLADEGGRATELARAYVYLSIAYLGLSQEQQAKAQFVEALNTDRG